MMTLSYREKRERPQSETCCLNKRYISTSTFEAIINDAFQNCATLYDICNSEEETIEIGRERLKTIASSLHQNVSKLHKAIVTLGVPSDTLPELLKTSLKQDAQCLDKTFGNLRTPSSVGCSPKISTETIQTQERTEVAVVRKTAIDHDVFHYTRERINPIIQQFLGETNPSALCSNQILLITAANDKELVNNLYSAHECTKEVEVLEDVQVGSENVVVLIGHNREDTRQICKSILAKSPETSVCLLIRDKRKSNIGPTKENIEVTNDGIELLVPCDLWSDQIPRLVDDLLEYYAFEQLARVAEEFVKSEKASKKVIGEMQALYKKSQVPMPKWLETRSQEISEIEKKVSALPYILHYDFSKTPLTIKILSENESKQNDVAKALEQLGVSEGQYKIQLVDIKQLGSDNFKSGDGIQVRGSNRKGTLGAFAKLETKKSSESRTVAVTSKHILHVPDSERNEIIVNNEKFGNLMEDTEEAQVFCDMAIAHVTVSSATCDTLFRTRNGRRVIAEICESSQMELQHELVHLWSQRPSPATAKVSSSKAGRSYKDDYYFIETASTDESQHPIPGDSGAMVLIERHPRQSKHMYAIGTLVGEIVPQKKTSETTDSRKEEHPTDEQQLVPQKEFLVTSLKKGFDHLSTQHDGSLTLFAEPDFN